MHIVTLTMLVLILLQAKHFVADYLLQPTWILKGKGDLRLLGGYVHAGAHAVGSIPAFLVAGLGLSGILVLCIAEFVVHYAIDYSKCGLSSWMRGGPDARIYWAMHGGDQFMHQLTYVVLTYLAVTW